MVVFLLKRTCKWLQTCFRGTFKTFMLLFVPLARSLLMMRKTHIRVTQHRNCNKLVYLFSTFLFSLSLALSLSPFCLLQYFCHWMEPNNDQKHKHKSKCFCQRFFLCLLLFFLSSLSLYSYASNNIFWFESAYRCLISLSSLYLFRTYTVSTSRNCGP